MSAETSAFERVVSRYQESRFSSGDLGAMAYGLGAEVGKATNTGSSSMITPSDSDFVCDVEIAAYRSLSYTELDYFNHYYKSGNVVVEQGDEGLLNAHLDSYPAESREQVAEFDLRMRTKMGARLIQIGLYPTEFYMETVDVRAPKPKKSRWSHLYGN